MACFFRRSIASLRGSNLSLLLATRSARISCAVMLRLSLSAGPLDKVGEAAVAEPFRDAGSKLLAFAAEPFEAALDLLLTES